MTSKKPHVVEITPNRTHHTLCNSTPPITSQLNRASVEPPDKSVREGKSSKNVNEWRWPMATAPPVGVQKGSALLFINVPKKRQRNPLKGSRVFCCNPSPTQEHDQRIYAKPQQTLSHPPHRLHTSIITAFPQILHLLSSPRTLIRQSIQSLCP